MILVAAMSATATPVSLGGFNFDTDDAVTSAEVTVSGTTLLFFGVGLFPDDPAHAIGTLAGASGGEHALDLATAGTSNSGRTDLVLTWDPGDVLTNQIGDDFIVFEQGGETFVEAFGVAVRQAGAGSFSGYRYEHFDSTDSVGSGKNITAFDLSDFGIGDGFSIDAISIINIHNATANSPAGGPEEDRVDDASGEGNLTLDAGSGSGFQITTGPGSGQGNIAYVDSGLDVDIIYVVALNPVGPPPILPFCDDFNTDTSANYSIIETATSTINTPSLAEDASFEFAFDYSTPSAADGTAIPVAPKTTDATTLGLRLEANINDANGEAACVNLYPVGVDIPAGTDYTISFDMWINYNFVEFNDGSFSGTTNFLMVGAFGDPSLPMWNFASGLTAAPAGIFVAASGDGDSSFDYRLYYGDTGAGGFTQQADGAASGWVATANNHSDTFYQTLFPPVPVPGLNIDNPEEPGASDFVSRAGAAGKQWVEVELTVLGGTVTWRLNGTTVMTNTNTSGFDAGSPVIGYFDFNTSISGSPADQFGLIDNLCIQELLPPTAVRDFTLYR
jgi:hypothetical protein